MYHASAFAMRKVLIKHSPACVAYPARESNGSDTYCIHAPSRERTRPAYCVTALPIPDDVMQQSLKLQCAAAKSSAVQLPCALGENQNGSDSLCLYLYSTYGPPKS